jgi:sugar phosphate isomerase/epimerase
MKPTVGLQLYTVRDELRTDFAGTLREVAKIGYPAVQLAGYGGMPASQLKGLLDDLGLAAAGSHVNFDALDSQTDEEIEYCLALGTPDVIVPAMPQAFRGSADGFRRLAEAMNRIGARCRELNARLSYHNHAFEFERFDGQYGLDLLLSSTDPKLVNLEPDVYWIRHADVDPSAYIRKYARRTPVIHLKDMTAGADHTYAEVGEGILDWPAIFAACDASQAEIYVVEQDRCARPALESAAISLRHLREWGKA